MRLSKYEPRVQKIWVQSQKIAKEKGHQAILPQHLLWSLIHSQEGGELLSELKVLVPDLLRLLEVELTKLPQVKNAPTHLSPQILKLAQLAESKAEFLVNERILLMAMADPEFGFTPLSHLPLMAETNHTWVQRFTRNLTRQARAGELDPLISREPEIKRMIQILSRRQKNSLILVGEPGVGKNTLIQGLVQRMVSGEVPSELKGKELLWLDMGSLLAGTTLRGQFEERLKSLLMEIKDADGRYLLFVDEIHSFIGAGGEGASDAASLIKPALASGEIQVLGTSTPADYRARFSKDPALERRFQLIWVLEPTESEALCILKGVKEKYESYHQVQIQEAALHAALQLSVRYLAGRALPDKAIDLIDEASARVHISKEKEVTPEDIAEVVSDITGIPLRKMLEGEREKLTSMEARISKRVVGQKEAVRGVTRAIQRSRAGLSDPGRPVGTFLFLGPTGVGKTELAKSLTDFLFDDEKSMIRLDMSEFMEKHSVARLIGAPPGYEGASDGGQLTEAVRRKPYAVVLFDEIEKAHVEVLNLLLQIMDEGRLTDSQGRLVDFKNTVIIMTSNVGAYHLLAASIDDGVIEEPAKEAARAELLQHFRPEWVNRIDEIIMFHGLTRGDLEQIFEIQLRHLEGLLGAQGLYLKMTSKAKQALVDAGFEPAFGARPLRRAIQRWIQDPLSLQILEGRFTSGNTVLCDVSPNGSKEDELFNFTPQVD